MTNWTIKAKIYRFIQNFFEDDTTYFAASLSFYTIFALFPILALLVAVFSATPFFAYNLDIFLSYILHILNPANSEQFENFAKEFLLGTENLGTIGLLYSIFVFTMFFKDYERVVNKICKTKSSGFYKSIFFYIGFIILAPLIFAIFVFAISFANSTIFVNFITFIFAWILLIAIFKISIHRQVYTSSIVITTFFTLIFLALSQNLFLEYASINSTYGTIYGSFSIAMLFFLWIYINWTIYLYGILFAFKLTLYMKAKKLFGNKIKR